MKVSYSVSRFLHRKFSSALYITGDKAQNAFAVLTPVVDFGDMQKDLLEQNIKNRKLSIDISKIEEKWAFFKMIESQKKILEETRQFIIKSMEKFNNDSKEKDKFKLHLKTIKEDYKYLRDLCYGVEERVVLQVLDLPNVTHPETPLESDLVLYKNQVIKQSTDNHMIIGEKHGYIKYIDPMVCFLKSDAAQFELAVQNYFQSRLIDYNYSQFSNSDFARSVVVEGCGTRPTDSLNVFTLEDMHCIKNSVINKLHLVGASSVYSFMAYFTKHQVQHIPIKAFSVGRSYSPVGENLKSLFNLSQTSNVSIFMALSVEDGVLETILQQITSLYEKLGYHFQIVLLPAHKLTKAESLRASIQMFSNNLQQYVEVGRVSFFEDYFSKRLLFNYTVNKERRYLKVVAGPIVNIHKLLGCVLENNAVDGKPLLSDTIKAHL